MTQPHKVFYPGTIEELFESSKWRKYLPIFRKLQDATTTESELNEYMKSLGIRTCKRLDRFIEGQFIKHNWYMSVGEQDGEKTYKLLPIYTDELGDGVISYSIYRKNREVLDKAMEDGTALPAQSYLSDPEAYQTWVDSLNLKGLNTTTNKVISFQDLIKGSTKYPDEYLVIYAFPSYNRFEELSRAIDTYLEFIMGLSGHKHALYCLAQGYSQEEFNDIEINRLVNVTNEEIHIDWVDPYPKPISQTRIREDVYRGAEALAKRLDSEKHRNKKVVYVFFDDDFEFKNGSVAAYDSAVDYLHEHPAIGIVQCSGYLGGYYDHGGLLTRWNGHLWMDRGMVVRPLDGQIFFRDDVGKEGGLFETYMYLYFMLRGSSIANLKNVPTLHHSYKYQSNARQNKIDKMTDSELKVHMHAQKYVEDAFDYFNSVLGEGVYTATAYAPRLSLKFKKPSLEAFRKHLISAKERFGYSEYCVNDGVLSRGLPKKWRDVADEVGINY